MAKTIVGSVARYIVASEGWTAGSPERDVYVGLLAAANHKGEVVFRNVSMKVLQALAGLQSFEDWRNGFESLRREGILEGIEGGVRITDYGELVAATRQDSVRESKREWARRKRAEEKGSPFMGY